MIKIWPRNSAAGLTPPIADFITSNDCDNPFYKFGTMYGPFYASFMAVHGAATSNMGLNASPLLTLSLQLFLIIASIGRLPNFPRQFVHTLCYNSHFV
jgi:hypothetical protein